MRQMSGVEWWVILGIAAILLACGLWARWRMRASLRTAAATAAATTTTTTTATTAGTTASGIAGTISQWRHWMTPKALSRLVTGLVAVGLLMIIFGVSFRDLLPTGTLQSTPARPVPESGLTVWQWLAVREGGIESLIFLVVLFIVAIWVGGVLGWLARALLVVLLLAVLLFGPRIILNSLESGMGWVRGSSVSQVPPFAEVHFTATSGNELRISMLPNQIARARANRGDLIKFCLNVTVADMTTLRNTGPFGTAFGTGWDTRDWEPSAAVRELHTRQNRPLVLQVHRIPNIQTNPCP